MESHPQVGAEVRRLNVIYFLSRNGRTEHPHLIRVHQLSRNGVHLRDVKRWLSELRGKDLPESFAWSYKRRYKGGYVWQDLLDEDLITPISDSEYVLKGSEISSSLVLEEDSKMGNKFSIQKEKEGNTDNPPSVEEDHHLDQEQVETKMSSPEEIFEELEDSQTFASDKSSTVTDDNQDQEKHSSSFSSSTDASSKQQEEIKAMKKSSKKNKASNNTPASSPRPSFSKSNSKHGASHLFRNLITCGAIDTNDSAMVSINRGSKESVNDEINSGGMLQKSDKLGGSQRVFGTKLMLPRQQSGRKSFDGVRASPKNSSSQSPNPAYMPIYGPKCSQCGKHFKPEKLHSHMKSCKGMKAWAKNNNGHGNSAKTADKGGESSQQNFKATRFQSTS